MKQITQKIKSSVLDIILSSTFHGYPSVFRTKRWLFKIVWLLLSLTFTAFCVYFSTKNFIDYLDYSFVTSISEVYEPQSQFPTISFCRTRDNLNETFKLQITECVFNGDVKCLLNQSLYFEQYNDNYYGKCYRFNSGKSMDILNSSFPGHRYGLRIEMYVEPSQSNELIVHIHNSSSPSNELFFEEYSIGSGCFNYFPINRVLTKNLEPPYGNCLQNIESFNQNKTIINYIKTNLSVSYSQALCKSLYRNLYYKETANCGCDTSLFSWDQVIRNCYFLNQNQTIVKCSSNFFTTFSSDDFYAKYSNYCPLECEITTILTEPYLRILNLNSSFNGKIRSPLFDSYDKFRTSFYSIIVFYREIKYTLQVQQPKAQFFDLVSNIGGLSGVFIGISFLSFVEVVELILEVVFIYCEHKFKFNNNTKVFNLDK